ncbi:hypothetical protein K1719_015609 [Acacia pycnantha]|nr:hypothetical protein K1719_015609 [Acacia pycnantha]
MVEASSKQPDSELWKSIVKLCPKVLEKVCWNVGNGEDICFWTDKWLDKGKKLTKVCPRQLIEVEENLKISVVSSARKTGKE